MRDIFPSLDRVSVIISVTSMSILVFFLLKMCLVLVVRFIPEITRTDYENLFLNIFTNNILISLPKQEYFTRIFNKQKPTATYVKAGST